MNARHFLPAHYVSAGDDVTFGLMLDGHQAVVCWRKDGQALPQSARPSVTLANVGTNSTGTYSVLVQDGLDEILTDVANLVVVAEARLTQFRAVAPAIAGLQLGCVIDGAGVKHLQIQGTEGEFFRAGPADTSPVGVSQNGCDLPAGSYAFLPRAPANGSEIAAELVDRDAPFSPTCLTNLSARAFIAAGTALEIGFTVEGTTALTLLVRGIGAELARFGLATPLQELTLRIKQADGAVVATAHDQPLAPAVVEAMARSGAFPLQARSGNAAVVVTLSPRTYSATLAPHSGGAGGTGLFEIYEVPSHSG